MTIAASCSDLSMLESEAHEQQAHLISGSGDKSMEEKPGSNQLQGVRKKKPESRAADSAESCRKRFK